MKIQNPSPESNRRFSFFFFEFEFEFIFVPCHIKIAPESVPHELPSCPPRDQVPDCKSRPELLSSLGLCKSTSHKAQVKGPKAAQSHSHVSSLLLPVDAGDHRHLCDIVVGVQIGPCSCSRITTNRTLHCTGPRVEL